MTPLQNKRRRTAYFGVFVAMALMVSYVESLIPFYFGVPGMKAGLANIVILMALYYMGAKEALILSVVRILLVGFLFGNMYSILYSLAGAFLSLLVMVICKKSRLFSIVGTSIAGGIFHNIGQVLVAVFTVKTWSIAYYLPLLLIAGLAAGMLIGIVSGEIMKRLPGDAGRGNL